MLINVDPYKEKQTLL